MLHIIWLAWLGFPPLLCLCNLLLVVVVVVVVGQAISSI